MNLTKIHIAIPSQLLARARRALNKGDVKAINYNDAISMFNIKVKSAEDFEPYEVFLEIKNGFVRHHKCNCGVHEYCIHEVVGLLAILNLKKFFDVTGKIVYYEGENEILFERYKMIFAGYCNEAKTEKNTNRFINTIKFDTASANNLSLFCQRAVSLFQDFQPLLDSQLLVILIRKFIRAYFEKSAFYEPLLECLSNITDPKVKRHFYETIVLENANVFTDETQYPMIAIRLVNAILASQDYKRVLMINNEGLKDFVYKYISENKEQTQPLSYITEFASNPGVQTFDKLVKEIHSANISHIVKAVYPVMPDLKTALFYQKKVDLPLDFPNIELTFPIGQSELDQLENDDKEQMKSYLVRQLDEFEPKVNNIQSLLLLQQLNFPLDVIFKKDRYLYLAGYKAGVINPPYTFLSERGGLPTALKNKIINRYNLKPKTSRYPCNYDILIHINPESDKDEFEIFEERAMPWGSAYFNGFISDEEFLISNSFRTGITVDNLVSFQTDPKVDEQYEKVLKLVANQKKQFLQQKSQKITLDWIDDLSKALFDKPMPKLNEKVAIKIVLDISNVNFENQTADQSNNAMLIFIKIGLSKLYVVKNISSFLDAVENNKYIEYGKRLAFYHTTDAFDERSQNYLDVLNSYSKIEKIGYSEGLWLSQAKFASLFEYFKGDTVIIQIDKNEHEFYVSPQDFAVTISLEDNQFITNIAKDFTKYNIIKYKTFDILIDYATSVVYKIGYLNDKQRTLMHFTLNSILIDMEFGINEFAKKVMPLINQEIVVSDEIRSKIDKNVIKIETWFDYDEQKDVISAIIKYFSDSVELTEDMYPNYQLFIDNYQTALAEFGFDLDHKITRQADIVHFLRADLSGLKTLSKIYISSNLSSKQIISNINPIISITQSGGMLKTHISASELDNDSLKKVLDAYRLGKKYVLLGNNVILTDSKEVVDLAKFMEHNELKIKDLDQDYLKPIYELFKLDYNGDAINLTVNDQAKQLLDEITNYSKFQITDKPKMYDLLKPYQKEGLKWFKAFAKHNIGGILADDMGLGKTLQTIAFLESESFNISMVICPKSLIYNWANELEKFGASFNHIIYTGTKAIRNEIFDKIKTTTEKTLVITSYDTLRSDVDLFKKLSFGVLILDEAQHIKTVNAQKTLATKEIMAQKRFILTGTPIENSIFDLWSMFDFLMPGYLYKFTKFKRLGEKVNQNDEETLNFLIKKTKPFILRRTKKEVLKELPEKSEEVLYATFDGHNRKVYDAYLLKVREKLNNPEVTKLDILKDLTRLRQLCISPNLVYDNYVEEQIKIDVIVNLINEAISHGHKILVFSSFVKALELLNQRFDSNQYFMLTGDTPAQKRIEMATNFNKENSVEKVFFISLKAGGTGLNLTGADIVIHLDPWWNVAAENQASDRAHRIGQKQRVTVYKVVMKDSIEEKIIMLQNKKKDLFDKMINNNENAKLSDEDYRFILS